MADASSSRAFPRPRAKRPAAKLLPKPLLITRLQEAYSGRPWHGPSVREVLNGVSHEEALLRPCPERPTIWETVLHLTYVRHREIFRMARAQGSTTPRFLRRLRSSCWPELPAEPTAAAWKSDQELLDTYHAKLIEALERAPKNLLERSRSRNWQFGTEILGIVVHDAYHAGQMRSLRLSIINHASHGLDH